MEEIYRAIEQKINEAGYLGKVDGQQIYNEICDEIEGRENGSYIFMNKIEEDTFFEYHIQVVKEAFNLSFLIIHMPNNQRIEIDFDA